MIKNIFLWGDKKKYGNYIAALHKAGCAVCPSDNPAESHLCDGLLLPGGGDIYGILDEAEYLLIQSFVDTKRPILGICRGMQALNVWFGGTLYGNISGHQLPQGDMIHSTRACDMMEMLLGKTPAVNSNHHQAVKQLGSKLRVIQWADDGIIEAVRHETLPISGVQWHPERQSYAMFRQDAADAAPLFDYFAAQMR